MNTQNQIPTHVAIIPDANRRWAKQRGLEPWLGHEEGSKRIEDIVKKSRDLGIKCLSFWGSSLDNLKKRPLQEKKALLDIYERYFTKLFESEELEKHGVCVRVLGRWEEQLPESVKKVIKKGIEKTKDNTKYMLNFFIAYSGDDEMIQTIQKMVIKLKQAKDVTKESIKQHLMTKDLPPVDYMIRTGGEPHLSAGFMMWEMANAQLYFTEAYFPDFNADSFAEAIEEYSRRGRRLGK